MNVGVYRKKEKKIDNVNSGYETINDRQELKRKI